MKISEIKELIKHTHTPTSPALYFWGGPGIGKSSGVAQAAQEMGIGLIDIRALLLDPTDLRGLPYLKDGQAAWAPPSFLPREGKGLLFLDELNLSPPLVQGSLYQLVLDHRCGEYILPEGWRILAAGNPLGTSGIGYRLPPPLRNRFIHIPVDVDLQEWLNWAFSRGLHSAVTAFNKWKEGGSLYKFEPSTQDNAFPTPRSWAFVSDILRLVGPNDEVIAGAIGQGMATEFMAFLQVYSKLPSVDDILAGKDLIPRGIDVAWALISSLIERARKDQKVPVWSRLVEYSMKLEAELAVFLVKSLVGVNKNLIYQTKTITPWAKKYEGVLL